MALPLAGRPLSGRPLFGRGLGERGLGKGSRPAAPTFLPLSQMSSVTALGLYGPAKAVQTYAGNLFKLCRVSESTTGGDQQNFAASAVLPDYSAISAWTAGGALVNVPEIVTLYDQSGNGNDIVSTGIETIRPYLNLRRNVANDFVPLVNNIFNSPTFDEGGVNGTTARRMTIPAGVSAQRGAMTIHMVIAVPSNAAQTNSGQGCGVLAVGANAGNRLAVYHADGSYATSPGWRIASSRTTNPGIKARVNYQSVIISTVYGGSGATSATNYQRISVDGETAVNSSASSITDATISGGELGTDNAATRFYGQFAMMHLGIYSGSVSQADEDLMHAWSNANFHTKPTAAQTGHVMTYGSSTSQDYRSNVNGLLNQTRLKMKADGYDTIWTGHGRTGTTLAQADTDAATVATYKNPFCTDHTVVIHGGVADLNVYDGAVDANLDSDAEQEACADSIYASLLSICDKFRADVSVTNKPWRVVFLVQHRRDLSVGGASATLQGYRLLALAKLADRIQTNPYAYEYTWANPNTNANIAAYPDGSGPGGLFVRDPDEIHMNEAVGHPIAAAILAPVIEATFSNQAVQHSYGSVSRDNGFTVASTTVYGAPYGQMQSVGQTVQANAAVKHRGRDKTIKGLHVRVNSNGRNTDTIFALQKNGVDQLVVTIPASTASTTTLTFRPAYSTTTPGTYQMTLTDGDTWNTRVTTGANAGTVDIIATWTEENSGQPQQQFATTTTDTISPSTTTYYHLAGQNGSTTANLRQHMVLEPGVFDKPQLAIAANTLSGASTLQFMVNGSAALTLNIAGGVSTFQEDASNTVSVVAGDIVQWKLVTGAGGTNLQPGAMSIRFTGQTRNQCSTFSGGNTAITAARYSTMVGRQGSDATEADATSRMPYSAALSKMYVFMTVNSASGTQVVTFRKNAASGTQTFTLSGAAPGTGQDTTHTDYVAHNDLIAVLAAAPSAGTINHTGGGMLVTAFE